MLEKVEKPAETGQRRDPVYVGSVVTVAGRGWREPPDALFVVVKLAVNGNATLYRLGGDERGAHWNSVPGGYLTTVDPKSISIA